MKRTKDEFPELKIIWIGFQDRVSRLVNYSKKMQIKPVGYDAKDAVSHSYGITYGAGTIFIDSEGTVRKRIAKGFSEKYLRDSVLKIVGPALGNNPAVR